MDVYGMLTVVKRDRPDLRSAIDAAEDAVDAACKVRRDAVDAGWGYVNEAARAKEVARLEALGWLPMPDGKLASPIDATYAEVAVVIAGNGRADYRRCTVRRSDGFEKGKAAKGKPVVDPAALAEVLGAAK